MQSQGVGVSDTTFRPLTAHDHHTTSRLERAHALATTTPPQLNPHRQTPPRAQLAGWRRGSAGSGPGRARFPGYGGRLYFVGEESEVKGVTLQ